jgi:hypothetical protein
MSKIRYKNEEEQARKKKKKKKKKEKKCPASHSRDKTNRTES